MKNFVRGRVPPSVFKELFIDLEDRLRAGVLQAHTVIKDGFKMNSARLRRVEGQARFPVMEQAFEEVCALHGGKLLDGAVIPLTDLKVFQPFYRFEFKGQNFILGLASIPEPEALPNKNMSRRAAVSLNYHLTPRLDFDGSCQKIGDVFILLLVARDRLSAGKIEEIAIGIVDSEYQSYLHYEPLQSFLSGHADGSVSPGPEPTPPISSSVRLKTGVTPYVPPEVPDEEKQATEEK